MHLPAPNKGVRTYRVTSLAYTVFEQRASTEIYSGSLPFRTQALDPLRGCIGRLSCAKCRVPMRRQKSVLRNVDLVGPFQVRFQSNSKYRQDKLKINTLNRSDCSGPTCIFWRRGMSGGGGILFGSSVPRRRRCLIHDNFSMCAP